MTFQILMAAANVDVRVCFRDCDDDGSKHVGNVSHKAPYLRDYLLFDDYCGD